MSQTDIKSSG